MLKLPRPSALSETIIVRSDHNHTVFSWGPVLGVVWRHETTASAARALAEDLQAFVGRQPGGKGVLLTIVAPNAPLPSAAAREALSQILRVGADKLLCSAVVMEGDGFRASAVRSVATGLAIVARQPFPHRVFSTTEQALQWVGRELQMRFSTTLRIGELGRDLGNLRSSAINVA